MTDDDEKSKEWNFVVSPKKREENEKESQKAERKIKVKGGRLFFRNSSKKKSLSLDYESVGPRKRRGQYDDDDGFTKDSKSRLSFFKKVEKRILSDRLIKITIAFIVGVVLLWYLLFDK